MSLRKQDILRFDVAMEDAMLMTVVQGVKYLQKGDFDSVRPLSEVAFCDDGMEHIAASTQVEHNVDIGFVDDDFVESDDVGMVRSSDMTEEFALLETRLERTTLGFTKALDGKACRVVLV